MTVLLCEGTEPTNEPPHCQSHTHINEDIVTVSCRRLWCHHSWQSALSSESVYMCVLDGEKKKRRGRNMQWFFFIGKSVMCLIDGWLMSSLKCWKLVEFHSLLEFKLMSSHCLIRPKSTVQNPKKSQLDVLWRRKRKESLSLSGWVARIS